jgi:hypothetical protein
MGRVRARRPRERAGGGRASRAAARRGVARGAPRAHQRAGTALSRARRAPTASEHARQAWPHPAAAAPRALSPPRPPIPLVNRPGAAYKGSSDLFIDSNVQLALAAAKKVRPPPMCPSCARMWLHAEGAACSRGAPAKLPRPHARAPAASTAQAPALRPCPPPPPPPEARRGGPARARRRAGSRRIRAVIQDLQGRAGFPRRRRDAGPPQRGVLQGGVGGPFFSVRRQAVRDFA